MSDHKNKKDKDQEIKDQAVKLEQKIKDSTKELEEIQKECLHPEESQIIKNINPTGSSHIRKVCDLCGHVGRYPNQDELDLWTGDTTKKDKKKN